MARSKYAQSKTFDTTNTAGQSGPSPQDATNNYTSFTITPNPTNKTNKGIGSIVRGKYRYPTKAQLNTTESPSTQRDSFDLARADDLT